MEVLLKAVTVTYTRSFTFIPTAERFADWVDTPDQESVNFCAFEDLFGIIHDEIAGPKIQNLTQALKNLKKVLKLTGKK